MNCTRLIVTAAVIAVGQVAAKEPTLQDYEILGALVAGDAIHAVRGPVYVWHLIEPLSAISPGGIKSALSFFPEARPTASVWESESVELDVHRLNAVIDSSPYRFIKPQPVKLLDRSPVQPSANQVRVSGCNSQCRFHHSADASCDSRRWASGFRCFRSLRQVVGIRRRTRAG
jgi:hypothetical protein